VAGSENPHIASEGTWLGDPTVFHGEGAFWDPRSGVLRHVDMLAGDIVTLGAGGAARSPIADVVALLRRRAEGFVAAIECGFALLDDELRIVREIPVFDDPRMRMNEGGCDPMGRLFCGSMAYSAAPGAGTLYRLDADLTVSVALEGVTIPNGLVWTDGGSTALHADTVDERIWAYDYDLAAGAFGERRVFADLSDGPGAPDGMALDDRGGVWVALWGGGCVRRYNAEGDITDEVRLDVTNPTSCAFGGPGGHTLFVTTSKDGLGGREEPHAGLVFAVETTVSGAGVHEFAG